MIVLYILFAYLLLNVAYYFFFTAAGLFGSRKSQKLKVNSLARIALFIPAYKEDGVIADSARKALMQRYPSNQFEVFVIADSLQPSTIAELNKIAVKVLNVNFEQSTKAKAINKAYGMIKEHFDLVVVLDADNVMENHFLSKINAAYQQGHKAIQAHRVAKNSQNNMAVLDGVSEEVNNHIFRRGHQNVGLSSALIGSGMAFDYTMFRNYMSEINAIGGFDKALELALLKDGVRIHYLEDALVYDEKVSNDQTFTRQRTRWIAAQIRYGIGSFGQACYALIRHANFDYFDKSLQFLLLPRLILMGVLAIVAIGSIITIDPIIILTTFAMLGIYLFTLVMAMPSSMRKASVMAAAVKLPSAFVMMIVAILGYHKAKNNFLHTPHQTH